jgi:hypothetical protein
MKALLSFAILTLLAISVMGVASASLPVCATVETTYVAGTISNEGSPVDGATVEVTCNGHTNTTTSASDGSYSVEYPNSECTDGDNVTVSATKDSLSGSNGDVEWYSEDTQIGCLRMIVNVACANVPLIPEFGIVIGTLTMVSAIVAFFVIRKK